MNTNSANPFVGRRFQDRVRKIAESEFKQAFVPGKPVAIGKEYFRLMDDFHQRKTTDFGEILLRLYQTIDQIEASFASKMLSTLDADMPILDSNVLQVLKYKLSGKTPELKMSNAVVLYDKICSWYKAYLRTNHAKNLIDRFDA